MDGPRLARILAVVGKYLGGPPPLDSDGRRLPPLETDEAPRTNQVDVALDVPLCRVVLLGPEASSRCLVVTVRDLCVRFRQRGHGDRGFRAQTYRFRDATISLAKERDAHVNPSRDSAKTIVRGTCDGAFEYLSRWPAQQRPQGRLSVCADALSSLFGDAPSDQCRAPDGSETARCGSTYCQVRRQRGAVRV